MATKNTENDVLVRQIFYHIVSWMEDEGDYQPTKEEAQERVREILAQSHRQGYEEGLEAAKDAIASVMDQDNYFPSDYNGLSKATRAILSLASAKKIELG